MRDNWVGQKIYTTPVLDNILAGDMNFDEGSPGEEVVVEGAGFADCWLWPPLANAPGSGCTIIGQRRAIFTQNIEK